MNLKGIVGKIPQNLIVFVGKRLGSFFYYLDGRHRRIVRRNLEFTHPNLTRTEILQLSKAVFQNMGITLLEILQLSCLTKQDILNRVKLIGEDHFEKLESNAKGTIVISAHIGNWEMAHIYGSCYLNTPLTLIARQVKPDIVNQWLNQLRGKFGSQILDKSAALPKMIRALRRGAILGILIDQGTLLSAGVEISFFGKKTNATPGAAILARRYGCPVIPTFCVREKSGYLKIIVKPPLELKKTDNFLADIQANTQIMMDVIEEVIREYPDQWFWFHKRWKRHHPYLYPEDWARRKLQKRKKKLLQEKIS